MAVTNRGSVDGMGWRKGKMSLLMEGGGAMSSTEEVVGLMRSMACTGFGVLLSGVDLV